MKLKEADHPEVFANASPTFRVHPDAPPFFVLQGANDTLVPVESARTFVQRLRAVSRQPVAYAELPLAQHAFDVVASLRCQATTSGVADFLEGARAAHVAAPPAAIDVTAARNVSDIKSPPGI
jgi:acetyl esterase/lipase